MRLNWFAMLFVMAAPVLANDCERSYRSVSEHEIGSNNARVAVASLESIFAHANCTLTISYGPFNFARRQQMLMTGEIDVLSEASRRPERETYAVFSEPYRTEMALLFVRADKLKVYAHTPLADIPARGWRVIDSNSAWFGSEWKKVRANLQARKLFFPLRTTQEAARDVRLGRADMFLATDWTRDTVLKGVVDIVPLPEPVYSEPVSLMFSRVNLNLHDVELLNRAIKSMKAAGDL